MTIHEMQNLNRATIEHASKVIVPGMTLIELRKLCEEYMLSHGADSFWYWDVGAFVFAGDKTTVSVSGREYKTDDHIIEPNDIITIESKIMESIDDRVDKLSSKPYTKTGRFSSESGQ